MTQPAIRFDRVTFTFPQEDSAVLRDVSLEIEEGTFVLVTGDTGSGKSTLLRAANGLVPHFTGGRWDGAVFVHGRNTLDAAPRYLSDLVAFVPQDPAASFVVDRVEDELAYAMENLETAPPTMRRRVEETLDLLDIERLRDRSVRSLSGGEKQRVAIAAALTPGPRILLLDEPTSQLDPGGAEDVLAALQRMVHDLGLTVIIAEHRLERVAGFVDRAIGCHGQGRVSMGEPREVLAEVGTGPPVTVMARLAGWDTVPLTVREARRVARAVPPPREMQEASKLMPSEPRWLEVQGVTASYGHEIALKDVSLSLGVREIVALVGRNGAGKTTLLRCITGLHDLVRGRVSLAGEPPHPGRNVALTPQTPEAVLFKDTVAAEIAATMRATEERTDPGLLGRLGLEGLAERHPRDLSAGQRLLVAVGAIAATGAPLLLLDEPTRGLDPHSKETLARVLRDHAASGMVMFATHDVELVAEVATRVIMLAGGEVVADGSPSEILGDSTVFAPQMARVFGPRWLTPRQVAAALGSRA